MRVCDEDKVCVFCECGASRVCASCDSGLHQVLDVLSDLFHVFFAYVRVCRYTSVHSRKERVPLSSSGFVAGERARVRITRRDAPLPTTSGRNSWKKKNPSEMNTSCRWRIRSIGTQWIPCVQVNKLLCKCVWVSKYS